MGASSPLRAGRPSIATALFYLLNLILPAVKTTLAVLLQSYLTSVFAAVAVDVAVQNRSLHALFCFDWVGSYHL